MMRQQLGFYGKMQPLSTRGKSIGDYIGARSKSRTIEKETEVVGGSVRVLPIYCCVVSLGSERGRRGARHPGIRRRERGLRF